MTLREAATRVLEKWATDGVAEKPLGSNWGGTVSWILNRIGWGPTPWCQAAVWAAFDSVGGTIVRTATVQAFYDWAKANRYLVPVEKAHRGDQLLFEWDSVWSGDWADILDHVATVSYRFSDGMKVLVVEGNASDRMRSDRVYGLGDSRIKACVRVPGLVQTHVDVEELQVAKRLPLKQLLGESFKFHSAQLWRAKRK